jgi:hypothetical protein
VGECGGDAADVRGHDRKPGRVRLQQYERNTFRPGDVEKDIARPIQITKRRPVADIAEKLHTFGDSQLVRAAGQRLGQGAGAHDPKVPT